MPYKELMEGYSWSNTEDGYTGERELREASDGNIASLPVLGSSFPTAAGGTVPASLTLRGIRVSFPEDEHPHYKLSYKTPAFRNNVPSTPLISLDEENLESFQCHSDIMTLQEGDDESGLKWAISGQLIPFNIGKRIIVGEYTYSFTTSNKNDAYNHMNSLGKVLSGKEYWLFASFTLDQGTTQNGTASYRVTRTYELKRPDPNDNSVGWNHLWNPEEERWEKTTPALFLAIANFPDAGPF